MTLSFGVWHACNSDARGLQSQAWQQLTFGTDGVSYACSFSDVPAQRCNVLNLLSTESCKVEITNNLADTAAKQAIGCVWSTLTPLHTLMYDIIA